MRALLVVALLSGLAFAQKPRRPIAEVLAELSDKNPEVRRNAASSLRDYGDSPERLDPLEKLATSDPDAQVRMFALSVLGPFEVGKAARWRKLYFTILTSDTDESVRKTAAMHLTPAEPAAVNVLVGIFEKEQSGKVRNQIVTALVDGKVPKLADILIKMVETHPQPGRAIGALASTGDARAIPTLKAAVKRGLNGVLVPLFMIKEPVIDDIIIEYLDGPAEQQWDTLDGLLNSGRAPDPRLTPKLVKIWEAQDKATRKRSVAKLAAFDNLEADDNIHNVTRTLRKIAEVDQSPCEARGAAKGELKAYLTKILPKACGK